MRATCGFRVATAVGSLEAPAAPPSVGVTRVNMTEFHITYEMRGVERRLNSAHANHKRTGQLVYFLASRRSSAIFSAWVIASRKLLSSLYHSPS